MLTETASPTFVTMPPSARVWVFGAAESLQDSEVAAMLEAMDKHLSSWHAHGSPLVCGRAWQHDRFLIVAVDEAATGASGCSVDGLFGVLNKIDAQIGTTLVDRGRIYWRNASNSVVAGSRSEFARAYADGAITDSTMVFDTTVSNIGEWQSRFERPLAESWHARLVKVTARANP